VDVQAALDNLFQAVSLCARDKALVTELTYGYLRYKGRIDFILQTFLAKPDKLPPFCISALGLATYERLFLNRVPEYATRSWVTNYVRRKWGAALARLVTAYMTTLTNHLPDLHQENFYRQDACPPEVFLARYYALPPWIVAMWMTSYGEERTIALCRAQLLPALLGLRINASHSGAHELAQSVADPVFLRSGRWGVACERNQAKSLLPSLDILLSRGRLSRQSLAAQHVLDILRLAMREGPIWDVCAGRGGKTCYFLERTKEAVRASDVRWTRLQGLRQEIRRLGLRDIPVILARADQRLPWREKAGCIVVDAPCSGLGVLARRPDIKWKRTPLDLPSLQTIQYKMLRVAVTALRPSGRLTYITCTLNPAENEHQIDQLLREHPEMRVLELYQGDQYPYLREFFWAALLERR
jgi:16S rRNA (cytosine967-C5)-methyltransferase